MNPYFSFGRFFNLIKLNLSTHILTLALTFIIFFAIMGGINFWILHALSNAVASGVTADVLAPLLLSVVFFVVFILATPIIATLMASNCANLYHKRASATQLLLLPASKVEQFSVLYLLYVVIVPVLFYLGTCFIEYYFIHHAAASIADLPGVQVEEKTDSFRTIATHLFDIIINPKLYLMILSSQSIFFAGAVFFKSHPYIKTILCMILLMIVTSILQSFIDSISFLSLDMNALTSTTSTEYISSIAITLVFSTIAWFKFKQYVLV